VGIVPHTRGHVVRQIHAHAHRIPGRCAELPARHRGFDACDELVEEGTNFVRILLVVMMMVVVVVVVMVRLAGKWLG
jgi:predicted nucleic acid-binding Zn ribbon protein